MRRDIAVVTSERTPSTRDDRSRTPRRFPWHALTVAIAALTAAVGAVFPTLLDPPDEVAELAHDAASLVLLVAVPLVIVAAIAAERSPGPRPAILRDVAFLAVVVALCTVAEPGTRVLVFGIAVLGLFAWGNPGDD